MKKLVFGLALISPFSSFADDCRAFSQNDEQLKFESSCNHGEITFEAIRIKHKGKYLKLGPVQGVPAQLFCTKLGLEYVSYEIKEYLFPRTIAIVHEEKEGQLIVDDIAKKSFEYASYFSIDEVICK